MTVAYRLVGVDGSEWDLSDPASPVRLVTDPEGIDGPPRDAAWQENVNQGGSYYKGQQDKQNVVKMRLRFGAGRGFTADECIDAAAGFRRALGTGRDLAEFHVVDEDEQTDRWQWVRCFDYSGPSLARLRAVQYVGDTQVSLTSDSSYWSSAPFDEKWTAGNLTGHTIKNEGDLAAWPQWEITGPTTSLKVGLGTDAVAIANLGPTDVLVVDTDPTCPRVHVNGDDAWAGAIGRQSWRVPAPAGESIAVSITGAAARVRLVLPQQHWASIR